MQQEQPKKKVINWDAYYSAKLWGAFDPRHNKWDRRLLFEIANMRLDDFRTSEFMESDTSDEEGVWGEENIVISTDIPPGLRDSSSDDES